MDATNLTAQSAGTPPARAASTLEKTMSEANVKFTLAAAETLIASLTARVEALEAAAAPKTTSAAREMTDADAVRVLTGDLAQSKHKDAAASLGLSYGQIYSCRLEFTFKHVHKAMKAAGTPNPWVK